MKPTLGCLRGMRPDLSFGVDMFFIAFGFSADTFPGGGVLSGFRESRDRKEYPSKPNQTLLEVDSRNFT